MPRILVASISEELRTHLSGILSASGHEVFRCCSSGGDLRRSMYYCDRAIVIIAGNIPDLILDEFIWDFRDRVMVLLLANPAILQAVYSDEVYKLDWPCPGPMVTGAVEMLSRMFRKDDSGYNSAERDEIEKAKSVIMDRKNLSEPQAHRYLQKYAMNHGMRLSEVASRVLEGV